MFSLYPRDLLSLLYPSLILLCVCAVPLSAYPFTNKDFRSIPTPSAVSLNPSAVVSYHYASTSSSIVRAHPFTNKDFRSIPTPSAVSLNPSAIVSYHYASTSSSIVRAHPFTNKNFRSILTPSAMPTSPFLYLKLALFHQNPCKPVDRLKLQVERTKILVEARASPIQTVAKTVWNCPINTIA